MNSVSQLMEEFSKLFGWIWDLTLPDLAIASILPLAVWLLRNFLARFFVWVLSSALQKFGIEAGTDFRKGAQPAVASLLVAVATYLGAVSLDIPKEVKDGLLRVLSSTIAFFVFWLINKSVELLLDHGERFGVTDDYKQGNWLKQIVRLVVILLMLVVVLKIWGIDLGPALTGLGIAGAAVAFAAQDMIRNLIAGFNNAGEKRFRVGDWVRVNDDLQGTVEAINLRSTAVRRFDHGLTHVPNAELANNPLVNFSQRDARRVYWEISITYGTDAETLDTICERIKDYISSSGHFVVDPHVNLFVRLFAFEESSIKLLIDCFIASNERSTELSARHDLLLEVKRIVEDAGAHFAFPTRTVFAHEAPLTTS